MMFCPKCGIMLIATKKDDKIIFRCSKCGYETKKAEKSSIFKLKEKKEEVIIIGKQEQKIRTLPTAKVECPKCNNTEAVYWMVQTRGADESTTQFFRCTHCGYTWREMS